ncbi:pantetheine-phosphate adenylyltransferase [Actinomyces trachealis]|uniref:pantetheine-phosphate adenylyltransferase n=1 Tax=Actinomyces trachealis TaxID=2763540 RepID=UPI001892B01E|nr:pantetheine-phosphate adenylyltransferase [Actinomyces trachealis]
MTVAVYPGSFDPITLGHVDIVRRALRTFDQVVLAIGQNTAKAGRHLFDVETRVRLARESLAGIEGASVDVIPGLLASYCEQMGARAIIKGLRSGTDLDAEAPMALLNREIGGPETLFLVASPAYTHVSSSLVKDAARFGADITKFVTPTVATALRAANGKN